MSNQQWPPPGSHPTSSPWASPDPNWRPPQFQDVPSRDPRMPFGQQPPPSPAPEDLRPPRGGPKMLLPVLGIVAVIAVVLLGAQFLGDPTPPSPSPSAAMSATPTATRSGNYSEFEGNGDGIFELKSYRWDGQRLQATVRIEVVKRDASFAMFAFTNKDKKSYEADTTPSLEASPGQPFEGTISFTFTGASKSDVTLVLTTPGGRVPLTALKVSR